MYPFHVLVKPTAALHIFYSRDLSDLNVTFPTPTADWTPENGYPSNATPDTLPWRAFGAGAHLGLTLVLDMEADEFYCSTSAGVGFKVKNVTSN
jgi:amiloride-sensitive sodium channel